MQINSLTPVRPDHPGGPKNLDMKQCIKWIAAPVITMLVLSFLPFAAIAQVGDPDAPIDGGLSILLAAGVGYVAKKGYDARKRKQAHK